MDARVIATCLVAWQASAAAEPCIEVEVVDTRGRALPGAQVMMLEYNPDRDQGGSASLFTTDRRGRVCEEELFHGSILDVSASERVGGNCAGTRRVYYDPDRQRKVRVELDVHPVPRSHFRGRVMSGTTAVAGALVRLHSVSRDVGDGGDTCAASPEIETTSASDGTFLLRSVPHGEATIEVEHRGHGKREIRAAVPGAPHDISLVPSARWRGRVLGPGGEPLTTCSIFIHHRSSPVASGHCSVSGFVLEDVPAGEGELAVILSDAQLPLGHRTLVRPVQMKPGESREEDIRWPRGAAISGRLVTAAGAAVAKVKLAAVPSGREPPYGRGGDTVVVTTDEEGRFLFSDLAPGKWVLHNPYDYVRSRLEVAAGTTEVRFVVARRR